MRINAVDQQEVAPQMNIPIARVPFIVGDQGVIAPLRRQHLLHRVGDEQAADLVHQSHVVAA